MPPLLVASDNFHADQCERMTSNFLVAADVLAQHVELRPYTCGALAPQQNTANAPKLTQHPQRVVSLFQTDGGTKPHQLKSENRCTQNLCITWRQPTLHNTMRCTDQHINVNPSCLVVKRRLWKPQAHVMRSSKTFEKLWSWWLLCCFAETVWWALCSPFDLSKQRPPIGAGEYVLSDTTSDAELGFFTYVQFREREENSGFALEELSFRHHAIRAAWVEFPPHSRHWQARWPSSWTPSLLRTCCQHIFARRSPDAMGISLQLNEGTDWNSLCQPCVRVLAVRVVGACPLDFFLVPLLHPCERQGQPTFRASDRLGLFRGFGRSLTRDHFLQKKKEVNFGNASGHMWRCRTWLCNGLKRPTRRCSSAQEMLPTSKKASHKKKTVCWSLLAESNTKQNCSGSDHVKNLTYSETDFSCLTENGRVDISLRIVSLETRVFLMRTVPQGIDVNQGEAPEARAARALSQAQTLLTNPGLGQEAIKLATVRRRWRRNVLIITPPRSQLRFRREADKTVGTTFVHSRALHQLLIRASVESDEKQREEKTENRMSAEPTQGKIARTCTHFQPSSQNLVRLHQNKSFNTERPSLGITRTMALSSRSVRL